MPRYAHKNLVPPLGGWRYTDPDTGAEFKSSNRHDLQIKIANFLKENNRPVPYDLGYQVESQICERLRSARPELCDYNDLPPLLNRIKNFAIGAVKWAAEGFQNVSEEIYLARYEACAGSPKQKPCDEWRGEAYLGYGACGKCGCSRIKLFWPAERCPLGKWPKTS